MSAKIAITTVLTGSCELPTGDDRGHEADTPPAGPPQATGELREFLAGRAGGLLIGVSVYRQPADRNAVLFQVGVHGWNSASTAGRLGPTPPCQPPAGLADLISAGIDAGLIIPGGSGAGSSGAGSSGALAAGDPSTVFVDREIAASVRQILAAEGRGGELAEAHRRAAEYWKWRAAAWPQGRHTDIRDLLEARQHLLNAGDVDQASDLTGDICTQLRAWGDLSRAADLIQATLDAMPAPSASRAEWLHELGAIAQVRGEHAAAEIRYLQAAQMSAQVGDSSGVARNRESLGVLAQAIGDYRKAERHYREAATARRGRPAADREPERPRASAAGPLPGPAPSAGPDSKRRHGLLGRPLVVTALALALAAPAATTLAVVRTTARQAGRGSAATLSPAAGLTAPGEQAPSAAQRALRRAGSQLLGNSQLSTTPAAQHALAGGQVDPRLLAIIATMSSMRALRIIDFGDRGAGSGPGPASGSGSGSAMLYRSVSLTAADPAAGPAALSPLVAFLHDQRPPYLAAGISLGRAGGGPLVLRIAFRGPSPQGMLTGTR